MSLALKIELRIVCALMQWQKNGNNITSVDMAAILTILKLSKLI